MLAESPAEHFLKQDFDRANSMALRFTRHLPLFEAQAKKDVDDYANAIYRLNQNENGNVTISIDYQEYFKPPLPHDALKEKSKAFPAFVKRGIDYFNGEFRGWLESLQASTEVVQ